MVVDQEFVLLCPKCGNDSKKSARWLVNNPHPLCAVCGTDLSANRDELTQIISAAEETLADDLDRLRRGDES